MKQNKWCRRTRAGPSRASRIVSPPLLSQSCVLAMLQESQLGVAFRICSVVLLLWKSNGIQCHSDMESAITVKGQATIPREIREYLGLKPGDRLKFFLHPDGSVVLLPKLPARTLRGIVRSRRRRPVAITEMTKAAAEGASGRVRRVKNR